MSDYINLVFQMAVFLFKSLFVKSIPFFFFTLFFCFLLIIFIRLHLLIVFFSLCSFSRLISPFSYGSFVNILLKAVIPVPCIFLTIFIKICSTDVCTLKLTDLPSALTDLQNCVNLYK